MRILVVDDDSSIAKLLERILAHLGHEADPCTDSASALQKLANSRYDCVMCDYMLDGPGTPNGITVLAQSHDSLRILFTASYLTSDVSDALRNGVVHYVLRKPATIAEIKSLLDAAV